MPLISLWESNAKAISEFRIEQVVATAGDGVLRDSSVCANELRAYFSQIDSDKLSEYVEQCLASKFDKAGLVLQDLVNELGRRLDYDVRNGRYQGTSNSVGYDGIWRFPKDKKYIITEVKTTDVYRISLDTLVEYRQKLLSTGEVEGKPSILIVVGRQDTGELEAQVRGSRHAWDIRLISVEALCKLVKLKLSSDDAETGIKIREILMPLEYTRLDRLVDVMFTAAREVASDLEPSESSAARELEERAAPSRNAGRRSEANSSFNFTDAGELQKKRNKILSVMSKKISSALVKKSRALYWNADHDKRIACTMSKLYDKRIYTPYWYAFHPQWDEFLSESKEGYLVLGCMDLASAFAIPHAVIRALLPNLNTTVSERGIYWHIQLTKSNGKFEIITPKASENLQLSQFIFPLPEGDAG